jgi:hypothetical protein
MGGRRLRGSESFFGDLAPCGQFEAFHDLSVYSRVPDDWVVVITEVVGSIKAIEAGHYKDVNSLGVASITAILNAVDRLPIPYAFGGDGATVLFPDTRLPEVRDALIGLQDIATNGFGLKLRTGMVPVAHLTKEGYEVLVARYQPTSQIDMSFLAGDGVSMAERWVKDDELGGKYSVQRFEEDLPKADLSGFECRWSPLESRRGSIVTVIVEAMGQEDAERRAIYGQLMEKLVRLLGQIANASPAHADNLMLAQRSEDFTQEIVLRTTSRRGLRARLYGIKVGLETRVGSYLLRKGKRIGDFDGPTYKSELVSNTDYRKFDEVLRLVLDLQPEEQEALEKLLVEEHRNGRICYGTHKSSSANMTCMVFSRQGNHVHFVDGAAGGYTMAAKRLKSQRREWATQAS